jgi:hypothetical protein
MTSAKMTLLRVMVCILATTFTSGLALAQSGINMAWDDCVGSGNETYTKDVECADTGLFNIICSFVSPVDIPDFCCADWSGDVQVDAPSIPSWWLVSSHRYCVDAQDLSGATCPAHLWDQSPHPPIGLGPIFVQASPSRFTLRMASVIAAGEEQPVQSGVNYYSLTLQLKFRPGTAGDPGCQASASMIASKGESGGPTNGLFFLTNSATRNWVTWRTPSEATGVTPVKKSSWGAIKATYR